MRAVAAGTGGHGRGCIDMTGPIRGRGRGEDDRPQILLPAATGWPTQFTNRVVVTGAEPGQIGHLGGAVGPADAVVELAGGDRSVAAGEPAAPVPGADEP